MIEKKDWETAKRTFADLVKAQESQIVNAELNLELYKIIMPYVDSKLASFPADPMPEEVKELVKDIK